EYWKRWKISRFLSRRRLPPLLPNHISRTGRLTVASALFKDLCIDANDHLALAAWWADVLAYERVQVGHLTDADPILIESTDGSGPPMWVCPVAEAKVVKNRCHFDVWGRTEELLDRGATLVRSRDDEIRWDILADPEGNEFCVFAPK